MEVIILVGVKDFEHHICTYIKTACTLFDLSKGWKCAFYLFILKNGLQRKYEA